MRVGPTEEYCNYILLKPDLLWGRSDVLLDTPVSRDAGFISLLTDVGGSCNVWFARYPLNPEAPLTRWPQSLVDATHYYNSVACDRFFAYLRARHEHWPAWRMNAVVVEHPQAWSEAGDATKMYAWMWARRGSSLELGDALYQLATLLI